MHGNIYSMELWIVGEIMRREEEGKKKEDWKNNWGQI